jgi:hypothetical protein
MFYYRSHEFFVQVLLINAHYFAGAWDGKGAAEAAKIGR